MKRRVPLTGIVYQNPDETWGYSSLTLEVSGQKPERIGGELFWTLEAPSAWALATLLKVTMDDLERLA